MTMTYIVKVFNGEDLQTTLCFNDAADALEAEDTFKQAGRPVVVISEESDDSSFDECVDDEYVP